MNISKLSVICLLATASVFAQFPWETQAASGSSDSSVSSEETSNINSPENTASYAPAPSSSSVAETKSASPEGKTIFDNLRGHAYNPYSTVGAATAVGDLVTLPSYINGQRFFYVSPTDRLGYTAFGLGSGTAMLGLDNSPSDNLAALVLGYATPSFGVALNYSVAKRWSSNSNNKTNTRTTSPDDNIGLYFSMPMGLATFYANASWLTYAESNATDIDSKDNKEDYSVIEANVGLISKSGSLNYDGYLNAIRTGGTQINNDGDKSIDTSTYLGVALHFDVGYAALQSPTAKVIVGANNHLFAMFYDKIDEPKQKADNVMGLVISPNILAEVSLFDNWLAFTGATHALNLKAGDNDKNKNTSRLDIRHRDGSAAFAGIRYEKTSWAVEAQVAANMFNNPFDGFNGNDMFANFGGFIYF